MTKKPTNPNIGWQHSSVGSVPACGLEGLRFKPQLGQNIKCTSFWSCVGALGCGVLIHIYIHHCFLTLVGHTNLCLFGSMMRTN